MSILIAATYLPRTVAPLLYAMIAMGLRAGSLAGRLHRISLRSMPRRNPDKCFLKPDN